MICVCILTHSLVRCSLCSSFGHLWSHPVQGDTLNTQSMSSTFEVDMWYESECEDRNKLNIRMGSGKKQLIMTLEDENLIRYCVICVFSFCKIPIHHTLVDTVLGSELKSGKTFRSKCNTHSFPSFLEEMRSFGCDEYVFG